MDYCATNPNAIVRFHACDMRIKIHSDVRYINAAGARSQQVAISTLGTTTTTLNTSMPGYIPDLLKRFGHPTPKIPQYAAHKHNAPQYGVKFQLTDPIDNSPKLPHPKSKSSKKVGTLLYYWRVIGNTLMVALINILSEQSRATYKTQ